MSIKTELDRTEREVLEQLLQLRDRAKVRFHLLGMDAKQAYTALEEKVRVLEAQATRDGAHTFEALKQTAQELSRELNEVMTTHVNASVGLLTSVRSLMTSQVHTCQREDTLNHAAHLMWNGDCGVLPVLSEERVVGIITDRDICMAAYTQGKPATELGVEGAMSKDVVSCLPDESVEAALISMGKHRVRRLPVLTTQGKLVGMLTLADVVRWARPLTNAAIDAALVEALAAISARAPYQPATAAE